MRNGCQGIYQAEKVNVLDALNIMKKVWDNDTKYCSPDGIKRCWRKAGILPPPMMATLLMVSRDVGGRQVFFLH